MSDKIERRAVTVDGNRVRYTYNVSNREVSVPSKNLTFTATSYDSAPHEIKEAMGMTGTDNVPSAEDAFDPHADISEAVGAVVAVVHGRNPVTGRALNPPRARERAEHLAAMVNEQIVEPLREHFENIRETLDTIVESLDQLSQYCDELENAETGDEREGAWEEIDSNAHAMQEAMAELGIDVTDYPRVGRSRAMRRNGEARISSTGSREPHEYEPDHERQSSPMNTDPNCRVCGNSRRECERRR